MRGVALDEGLELDRLVEGAVARDAALQRARRPELEREDEDEDREEREQLHAVDVKEVAVQKDTEAA